MSVGINNTFTTKTKGKRRFIKSLLEPVVVGSYAMSTSKSNGFYNLGATALATIVGHPFAGLNSGKSLGTATAYVYNITQRHVQKTTVPLRYLINIGNNVFFTIGAAGVGSTRWDNIGLKMPLSGDSMAMKIVIQLDGAKPVGGWKQTWTAA